MTKLKSIYQKMWKVAKPHYEDGRVFDIPQIEWMLKVAQKVIKNEKLDEEVFIPLIILHDIGYTGIEEKAPNVKDAEIKRDHMIKGAKIAKKILQSFDLPTEKKEKVVELISIHDNWALGDNEPYKKSKDLAVFTDLDYMFPLISYNLFQAISDGLGEEIRESFEHFITTEEKLINRPLCCQSTKEIFNDLIDNFKKELDERIRAN
ncbi:MAG: HD domain-containing protein [Patescibacteria group bacterium]|nr:HD domain-containing protein [Patescibacteria group bacterium]